jgi:hypothetical protein
LRLGDDRRVFRDKEAREELEDFLVYLACTWLKERPAVCGPNPQLPLSWPKTDAPEALRQTAEDT